ncbi:MAG TPA: tetratricopeptide repeat protein [Caldimonas sp.]|nr:tetratricopeptide repeat protein [Caldimonas sp.]
MLRRLRIRAIPVVLAAACIAATADELDDVAKLRRDNQPAAALERADRYIAEHPRDAQMRFMRAVILADMGRTEDATQALERLTEDFPDLPEPYNNLAVLYAARGDYGQARHALDQALRLRPDYATAHENLGDVYAALAASAYATALRLDRDRPGLARKLAAVRSAFAASAAASSASAP